MGKKLAVLMTMVCIGLAAIVVKFKIQGDNQGPEITFSNTDMIYKTDMTDEELLEDVKAVDAIEGDVSSMTVVENVYKIADGQVAVIYAAKDSKNNITKVKRIMDHEEIADKEAAEEEKTSEKEEKSDSHTTADKITPTPAATFGLTETKETQDKEETEDTVSDTLEEGTEAETARKEQETIANEMSAACPRVYLTDYWIEVPVGTTIDALSYVKEITDDADDVMELWKKIQLRDPAGNQANSAISCAAAGTYKYTFLVVDSQNNVSNEAVLTIVVK